MFPEVYERLLRRFSPRVPRELFERAFVPRGWHDDDHYGYVLCSGGQPVGVLGTLFSRRQVDGRELQFCNLHNWYVEPDHRANSLLLMRQVLALRDCILTDLSPSGEVVAISTRLGFTRLDRSILLLPPLPWRGGAAAEIIDLQQHPERAAELLTPAEQQIYRDHQAIDCSHHIVLSDEGRCYLVSSRQASRWLPHALIHHVSQPQIFARHHGAIRARLHAGYYLAVCRDHLAGATIPYSFRTDSNHRLVRGECPAAAVDTLYSEFALFKLPLHPRGPEWLRRAIRRCWPRRNAS